MPAISMYSASVPVFVRMLDNLSACLEKAEAFAKAKGFDSKVLVDSRLAPDMLPLARQVQIACDAAKFGAARLAGVEAPSFEDNEASIAELQKRIRKTIDYVKSVDAAKIDGSEERQVKVPMRGRDPLEMTGLDYLNGFVMPNFYFHVCTAYGLLRHNGVDLGKRDYLGRS
ncbi:DUF1993 domain-containing protein [Piscinibacter sakaiensis]|uniref:DUF1993 domain-containing protein n=1 Tax=Piscinibacter sakaiensis TaxID=1547922 RepID=UPI003AAE4B7A